MCLETLALWTKLLVFDNLWNERKSRGIKELHEIDIIEENDG